jgi:hypothetical protein
MGTYLAETALFIMWCGKLHVHYPMLLHALTLLYLLKNIAPQIVDIMSQKQLIGQQVCGFI